MIVQLPLILRGLTLGPIHLGNLCDTRKDCIDDLFIPRVHLGAHGQVVRSLQVRFNALDKGGKVTNEKGDAFAFPDGGFCIVDDLDLLVLVISTDGPLIR